MQDTVAWLLVISRGGGEGRLYAFTSTVEVGTLGTPYASPSGSDMPNAADTA